MSKKVYVDLSQQDVQDIINAYEKDIEKFNKQKEVLDKIKEILKSNINFYEENFKLSNMTAEEFKKEHPYILGSYDDSKNLLERINELLEEIE